MNKSQQLKTLLVLLQDNLHELNLWQMDTPTAEQLASTQPFCVDTLRFEQWLQFIFIPKISEMIALNLPLPTQISLCPMAEESFKGVGEQAAKVINTIGDIDELMSGQRQQTLYLNK
ncbi:YqcC family protein [Thalassotalea mangrovi]|uniref:YqcC family protein n=1 Tax=Thalassotalea mangrovi TaxID=2572245 RepID=A0A4U1B622_9GAMM|nr:YqcC family protein [Thalassotalea mangrovi]TKB45952.1 YqcC family protein [Thalassotalea mangrovi]